MVTLPNNADWDCFKILTSREILKIQNPFLEEHCAFWKVPTSWMCKKQVVVSRSSVESEIISLNAGLTLVVITALDLWDLTLLVFGNTIQNHDEMLQLVFFLRDARIEPSQQFRGLFNVIE